VTSDHLDAGRIRLLSRQDDLAAVRDFILKAADYWALEQGKPPRASAAEDFFAEGPPGRDLSTTRKLGLFGPDGTLGALADVAYGYPEAEDAYLGLLVLKPDLRSKGLGKQIFAHLLAEARAAGARRMLLAVLDENPRARVFWEREGFQRVATLPGFQLGQKRHVVHRMARPIPSA